jgi:hypothetical protein
MAGASQRFLTKREGFPPKRNYKVLHETRRFFPIKQKHKDLDLPIKLASSYIPLGKSYHLITIIAQNTLLRYGPVDTVAELV